VSRRASRRPRRAGGVRVREGGTRRWWRPAAAAVLVAALAGAAYYFSDDRPGSGKRLHSYEELTGSVFLPLPKEPFRAPTVRQLSVPPTQDATGIWGAFGRDPRGHIWVGVSASRNRMSAHLLEYDPVADTWRDHGSVVDRLKAAGLYRDGMGQTKIHTKIVPAQDGWLYFASMDEEGERSDGSALPRWGGNLWRIHPQRGTWKHLAAVPEALIAVAGVGRYIYALGYWGHVLYQYDTENGTTKRVTVGSVGGHISRNFLADARGHAYVPRLRTQPNGSVSATLVEYDSDLKEVGSTSLAFYLHKERRPEANEGIVALAYLPDGRMLFVTHPGHLYQIAQETGGGTRAAVTPLGWLDPDGKTTNMPSLFVLGGSAIVGGIGRRGSSAYQWIVFDLTSRASVAAPLDVQSLKRVLLYGSITRDNDGRMYVGGWTPIDDKGTGLRPLVLQLDPGR
jgi:hypothetical protein